MNEPYTPAPITRLNRRSSIIFLTIGMVIVILTAVNWQYDVKPRLINEAKTNIRIMASARAQSIEAQFQNVKSRSDFSTIYSSINELLLINDPVSGQALFLGVILEVDYEALNFQFDVLDYEAGIIKCGRCISTENAIFNRSSGELIAIIRIFASPRFYQRLVSDIGQNLALMLISVLLIFLITWVTTNRLLKQLQEREMRLVEEILERKQVEERLQEIATYDQLTKLPNRYLLQSEFGKKLGEATRNETMLATLFFDLDHFKKINDLYGHETGDALLQEVSRRVTAVIRQYDLLARFGGDEFVMIMPNIEAPADVVPVVEKIIGSFKPAFELDDISVQITTSVGISVFPSDGNDPSVLLKNADMAMYRAKADGRNRYQFFKLKMNQDMEHTQWIEVNLKKAIEGDLLELHFQPQVNLKTGAIESCEALIRWPQPDGDFIDPLDFIRIAERTELINMVSNWVLDKACEHQRMWAEQGYKSVRIDINLSGQDFVRRGVLLKLTEKLKKLHLLPDQIGIEITENILLESSKPVIEVLTGLHEAGVHISIDDFGTGYSSLSYLKNFPVSGLKIDQSFVAEAPNNKEDQVIMQAIVTVGHGLGLNVTVEGVETEKHFALCHRIACNTAQGYYFSRPLPADKFANSFLV